MRSLREQQLAQLEEDDAEGQARAANVDGGEDEAEEDEE